LIVVLYGAGVWFGWQTRSHADTSGWGLDTFAVSVGFVATTFVFPLVGVLIATRRPGNLIAWLLLGVGAVWGLDSLLSTYAVYGLDLHQGSARLAVRAASVDNFLWVIAIGLMGTFLPLYFPDGRLPGPRWRIVTWVSAATITVGSLSIALTPGPMTDSSFTSAINPFGVSALATQLSWAGVAIILLPLTILTSAASLIVRFRRSHGMARAQLKWLVAATATVAGIFAAVEMISILAGSGQAFVPTWIRLLQDLALFSFALVPLAIGVAVLRYHLYEIDVIIRKTLVYTALAATLALLYLGGISLTGWMFRSLTGQSGALAVTLSTLTVAAAFQPLRHRIQHAVDRRFYRRKYDAARTLETFNDRLREQIDLDALHTEVLTVVTDTLQPSHATLWLRPTSPEAKPGAGIQAGGSHG
jgi:hypothetical protein